MVQKKKGTKNPPIFSQEFIITNHADIVACVAMVFVMGLMFQITSPAASVFVALHHNVTVPFDMGPTGVVDFTFYQTGLKDIAAIFFYLLISIVMHQIIQEYVLDKFNRKLHLSKVKFVKFNESGQLLAFFIISLVWAGDIIYKEHLWNPRNLWEGYPPHESMSFMLKFFFITQIAYWIHVFPELYFQRIKREEQGSKIRYAALHLLFIVPAYIFSFTRVTLCILVLQYFSETLFHVSRIVTYANKLNVAKYLYVLVDFAVLLARLGTVGLTVYTFWFGLGQVPDTNIAFRVAPIGFIVSLQLWLVYNYLTFRAKRNRELRAAVPVVVSTTKVRKTQQEKAKARKEKGKKEKEVEINDLPEVDQNTKKAQAVRQRK